MRGIVRLSVLLFFVHVTFLSIGQDKYDLGVELAAARGSNFGGTLGLGLKFGFLKQTGETEELVYGPSFR